MNNPQQPREYDAVLGGNSPSIENAAVLGGIEGVKLRLKNPDAKVRIAALAQAVNYGEQGLDLVIAGLKDESWDVQNTAYLLLKNITKSQLKQILIESEAHLRVGGTTDYSNLDNLLSEKRWKEADQETARLMLLVAESKRISSSDVRILLNKLILEKRLKEAHEVLLSAKSNITGVPDSSRLMPRDCEIFPCEDLHIIDKLWVKYSNGNFGFSVQKAIYQNLGGTSEYDETIYQKFRDKLNWQSVIDFILDIHAPKGHLPICMLKYGSPIKDKLCSTLLLARCETCGL